MQGAEAAPKSREERLRAWLGLSLDDDELLGGLGRRLAFAAAGLGLALLIGWLVSPWTAIVLLAIWLAPLVLRAGLWMFSLPLCLALLPFLLFFGRRRMNWARVVFAVAAGLAPGMVALLELALIEALALFVTSLLSGMEGWAAKLF
jgi:hypothetical protein